MNDTKKLRMLYKKTIIIFGFLGLFLLTTGLSLLYFTNIKIKTNPSLKAEVKNFGEINYKSGIKGDKLFELIQQYRLDNHLKQFKTSNFICDIARIRLEEIKKSFSHEGFSTERFCYSQCSLGENLAQKYQINQEEKLLNDWLNSQNHAAEIKSSYTHSCLKTDGNYVVQIFGYY